MIAFQCLLFRANIVVWKCSGDFLSPLSQAQGRKPAARGGVTPDPALSLRCLLWDVIRTRWLSAFGRGMALFSFCSGSLALNLALLTGSL